MTTLDDAALGSLIRDCYARLALLASVGLTVPALSARARDEAGDVLALLERAQAMARERMGRGM